EKGLTTRREFLADKAALEQARSQQTNAEGRLATLRQQLSEAENQYVSAEGEARRLWSEENSRIGAELSEATEAIAKLEDRVRRLTIRAPSEGVVQFVLPRSPGEVVKPGDTVARIVPVDAPLLAEVEIRADDIGHVKVGDPAELRVSTYDPSVFGKLHGKVVSLSPSTFQRQNGDY
ncbi:MAG: HlyD family efflux transporter periplasmic adaptor subunit, partial [Hyphomicrobiales bacterium]